MRYTGTKFSNDEAQKILRETAAHLKSGVRRHAAGIVYKTIGDARVPAVDGARGKRTRWNNASS
jgi:hypothetical protein